MAFAIRALHNIVVTSERSLTLDVVGPYAGGDDTKRPKRQSVPTEYVYTLLAVPHKFPTVAISPKQVYESFVSSAERSPEMNQTRKPVRIGPHL